MPSTAVPTARYDAGTDPAPVPGSGSVRRRPDARWLLLAVVLLSAVYVFWHLGRGWVPHDEGALSHSAERVLQGELPHRDFDEIYTGGLALLDAVALRVLGPTLWSIRLVLFAVFLCWVPTVHYLASRFVAPVAAAAVTLLAVVWSLPNYPAAMPSWYNLFMATFGLAALFRHMETGHRRWLVAAGLAGGLSFLVKVVGLYYVAGVFLYFVFRAHAQSRAAAGPSPRLGVAYAAFVSFGLLLFVAALTALVRHQLSAAEVMQFVVPGALIAALLVRNEWAAPAGPSRARFAALAELLLPFLAGLVLPIALFLVPYAMSGSLGSFVYGVFVLPTKRFGSVTIPALPLRTMLAVIPLALVAVAAARVRAPARTWQIVAAAVIVAALVAATGSFVPGYRMVWYSARNLLPVLVLAGVVLLARERDAKVAASLHHQRTMLVLAVAALCNLVQFPFAAYIYFCFVAPLVALTVVALWSHARPSSAVIPGALLALFLGFAVFRVNTSTIYGMGIRYAPFHPTTALRVERGGLDVSPSDAVKYGQLVQALRQRARGGYTWASPDCPEIYFLSGLKNPTRTMFELFDDPTNRAARILEALDARGVTAIVLNSAAPYSRPLDDELVQRLEARYTYAANLGNFQLRWRQ